LALLIRPTASSSWDHNHLPARHFFSSTALSIGLVICGVIANRAMAASLWTNTAQTVQPSQWRWLPVGPSWRRSWRRSADGRDPHPSIFDLVGVTALLARWWERR
jgi:hypothetical protein